MTREDRILACELRMTNHNWEEIGEMLGYSAAAVRLDVIKYVLGNGKGLHGFGKLPGISYWARCEGMTLTELSEKMGYCKNYVSNVLRLQTPMSDEFATKLSEITGISKKDILAEYETEKEKVPD